MAWALLLFVPVIISSARRIGRGVRHTTRKGQDKLAEIQNILHETITGNRIVKAFGMELWEMNRFRRAAGRLFRANLKSVSVQAISSPLMDALGSVAIALLLLLGREQILHHGDMTAGLVYYVLWRRYLRCTTRCGSLPRSITAFSRRWGQAKISSSLWMRRMTCRRRSALMR